MEGKPVLVFLQALEGASEPLGTTLVCTSWLNENGELEEAELPSWPFRHERECYEVVAVKPFDEIEKPTKTKE
jgi:hypothetical protein